MKSGQSSSDKHKKQQVATVRRPISTESVIEAASVENVNRASQKITNVLEQAVKSPNLDDTHFISLPLANHRELVKKLEGFQKSILEEVNMKGPNTTAMGIDRSIFINPKTFHLTVLMLKLWNKDRVAMATKILKEISWKVMDALENRPVSIRLRGVACMNDSPAKAHVVYAPVEEDGRLFRACQVIIDAYVEAGLVLQKDARRSLKLHATLMNSKHRKRKMHTTRNDPFDARDIFKRYGLEDWGEYVIREVHLSQRFIYDERGYYHCCGSIPFPGRPSVDSESNSQSKQPSRNHHHPQSAVGHHRTLQTGGHHHRPLLSSTTTANTTGQTTTSVKTTAGHRGPRPPPKIIAATSSSTMTDHHRPPPPPPSASCHLL